MRKYLDLSEIVAAVSASVPKITNESIKPGPAYKFFTIICARNPDISHPLALPRIRQTIMEFLVHKPRFPKRHIKYMGTFNSKLSDVTKSLSTIDTKDLLVIQQPRSRQSKQKPQLRLAGIQSSTFHKLADVVSEVFMDIGFRLPMSIAINIGTSLTSNLLETNTIHRKHHKVSKAIVRLVSLQSMIIRDGYIYANTHGWFQQLLGNMYVAFLYMPHVMALDRQASSKGSLHSYDRSRKNVLHQILQSLYGMIRLLIKNIETYNPHHCRHLIRFINVFVLMFGACALADGPVSLQTVLKNPLVFTRDLPSNPATQMWITHYLRMQASIQLDWSPTNTRWLMLNSRYYRIPLAIRCRFNTVIYQLVHVHRWKLHINPQIIRKRLCCSHALIMDSRCLS